MSKTQRKTVQSGPNQVVDLFRIDPKANKIRLVRNNHCSSIDDTKSIDAFAGVDTALLFPTGLHGSVSLRKDADGKPVQPRQAVAYWQPVGFRKGEGISTTKQEDKYANGLFLLGSSSGAAILSITDASEIILTGAQFAIQTGPLLVQGGHIIPSLDTNCPMGRTPRAIAGIDKEGTVLLVRIPFEITLEEAANFMVGQGAVSAVNLQGDSGALFWFEGTVYPSSRREAPRFCEMMEVKP